MCGIVAAASRRNVVPLLLEGLRRLEYRGYDSCGLATVDIEGLHRIRSTARVMHLSKEIKRSTLRRLRASLILVGLRMGNLRYVMRIHISHVA